MGAKAAAVGSSSHALERRASSMIRGSSGAGGSSMSTGSAGTEQVPTWLRVLAMETIRGLCSDAELFRMLWQRQRHDRHQSAPTTPSPHPSTSTLSSEPTTSCSSPSPPLDTFTLLITTLNRIATEKPSLLGVSNQMNGLGVPTTEHLMSPTGDRDREHQLLGSTSPSSSGPGNSTTLSASSAASNAYGGLELVAGMLSSGVSTVVASLTQDAAAGLGKQSTVKVQW